MGKVVVVFAAVVSGLSCWSGPLLAGAGVPVPDHIADVETVDAEGLIELVQTLPAPIMVDSRIASDRELGYIEGSISLPDIDTDCDSLADEVTVNKAASLLFYCNGVKCGRSAKSIAKAKACGYTRLYWFRGGFEEWRGKDYPYLKK